MTSTKSRVTWHVLFWLSLFLYNWLVNGALNDQEYQGYFYWAVLNTFILASATYFTIFILIEKYFFNHSKTQFYFILGVSLISFAVLRRVLNYFIIFKAYFQDKCMLPLFYPPKILAEGFGVLMISAMGVMFYFVNKWAQERQTNQQLLNDKLAAQMELLKSQVQPHFIFNTLNNIYSLSLTNPTLTSEMIYRLSGLLSYMLYDSKHEYIELEKEIEYINHYIKLQKLRFGNRLDVSLNVYSHLEGVKIPPLLLLPFVENCFKHGVDTQIDTCWISIDFSANDKDVTIKIENCLHQNGVQKNNDQEKSGIGIENIRSRLDILYPEQYTLKNIASEESYLVVLKLPLKIKTNTNKVKLPAILSAEA
jgi:two-component system, LytTR family, sensor kinase